MGQCAGKHHNDRSAPGRMHSKLKGMMDSAKHAHGANNGTPKKDVPKPDFGLGETHELLRELGRGCYGETWLTTEKSTGQLVAVKFIKRPLPKVVMPMILHEIQIQGEIGEGHINIIHADEVYLTHTHICLAMEYASGGSMTEYVTARHTSTLSRGGLFLTEDEARYFFRQFINAVEYCHSKHVAHRDLKLDNTLLDGSDPPYIKICDFGFAKNWGDDANMETQLGTPVYMSPELINAYKGKAGYDGMKADVWASGVLLFVMLLGRFPFDHYDNPDPNTSAAKIEVWLQQVNTQWSKNPRIIDSAKMISSECRDLLDKIFVVNEKERISIHQIKEHTWFNRPLPSKFQGALDSLAKQQSELDLEFGARISQKEHRNAALAQLLEQSTRMGLPTEPVQMVRLGSRYEGHHHSIAQTNVQEVGERPVSMDVVPEDISVHAA